MPKILEKKLEREYSDLPKKERDHAVYGTMAKIEKKEKKGGPIEEAIERKKKK